jgi:LysM repeat protein
LNLPVNYFALFEAKKDWIMNDTSQMVHEFEPAIAVAGKTIWYKVHRNETINKVAMKYNVTVSAIKKWNHLKSASVYPGQKLKIVTPGKTAESPTYAQAFSNKILEKPKQDTAKTDLSAKAIVATEDSDEVVAVTDTLNDPLKTSSSAEIKNEKSGSKHLIYHVVQPGDTLWNITQRYRGLTIDKLKADNENLLSRPIHVGDVLKIFL